jgi:predicted metal-dependent hydrolase
VDPNVERLAQGRAAFNRAAFYEAHERWEEAWLRLAGAERLFVQGLIQIAAGLHHLQQGRPRPAVRLLEKGSTKVRRGKPVADYRVDRLCDGVARVLIALEASAVPDLSGLEV